MDTASPPPSHHFFRANSYQPYHLSIGAVLFDRQGLIACHHFSEIYGHKDIYILMRETMENEETPLMTLSRGLMEEFAATGQPIAFLGSVAGPTDKPGLSYHKTILYFICEVVHWDPSARNPNDTEAHSNIEWMKPENLIAIMQRQGKQFQQVEADESEIILRALPYIRENKH